MGVALSIVLTLLLTIANGFFSMSEMALTTAKRATLEHDAEEGDTRATKALELANDSTDFLATIQVAITLVGFFLSNPRNLNKLSHANAPLLDAARRQKSHCCNGISNSLET